MFDQVHREADQELLKQRGISTVKISVLAGQYSGARYCQVPRGRFQLLSCEHGTVQCVHASGEDLETFEDLKYFGSVGQKSRGSRREEFRQIGLAHSAVDSRF